MVIALKNNFLTTEIYNIISNIVPLDCLEQEHIIQTLAWIRTGASILRFEKPDIPNKHLVSYFVLFDEVNRKNLLVDHKKAHLWLPTGGHVEVDEDPKQTVIRECYEEQGVKADFWVEAPIFSTSTVTVGITAGHTDVSLWYVLKGDSNIYYAFDHDEFNAICWFGFDDIPYVKSDPHISIFISKLKNFAADD